jgi:hypothetical protein
MPYLSIKAQSLKQKKYSKKKHADPLFRNSTAERVISSHFLMLFINSLHLFYLSKILQ